MFSMVVGFFVLIMWVIALVLIILTIIFRKKKEGRWIFGGLAIAFIAIPFLLFWALESRRLAQKEDPVETNPCSLSKDVLKDIQTLDSLIKLPEERQRYKKMLQRNYNEPSLLDAQTETYRFIWGSTFDTTEIDRIEKINGYYKWTKKIFATHADTIGVTREFEISENEWNNIVNTLAAYNFWTYPTSDNRKGLDGATWLLEGYKPIKDECTLKNYHSVGRWSPDDTSFIAMCKLFYKKPHREDNIYIPDE